jgi:phage portal protein BeeE
MGVMNTVWQWVTKKARGGDRNARASALRPYLAGSMLGYWVSQHDAEGQKYTGWTYCAVSALADQASQAQCQAYLVGRQRDNEGRIRKSMGQGGGDDSDRIPLRHKHPLMRLLNRPNPEQSGSDFRYRVMLQLSLTGTAHVWIVRNGEGKGVPVEMYVIPTGAATPLPPSSDHPLGQLRVAPLASFAMQAGDADFPPGSLGPLMTTGGYLDARDIKSIRLPHPLYLSDGWSPLAAGATVIDVETSLNYARWYSFKNSATPGMVLEVAEDADPSPEEMEAFRADIRNRNAGVANAGKDLLLPKGVTAKQIAANNREMDYTSSYPQIRDSVLALHKTPAVAIGVTEAGSYSAFYASLKQFTALAVQPRLDKIAEELTEALASDYEDLTGLPEDEHLVIEMKARAIDDPSIEEGELRLLIGGKAITINELRAKKGLAPIEWGDCPAGTDPIQWQQGQLQLKQAKEGGGQGGAGGGNPLAALMGGGAPGGGGGSAPAGDSPAPPGGGPEGQQDQPDAEDDPFAALFGDSLGGDGASTDQMIGDTSRDSAENPDGVIDEDGPNEPDPVRESAPKIKVKGYPVRLHIGRTGSNGHHRNGRV